MQISNITTSTVIPAVKATSSPQPAPVAADTTTDRAEFHLSASSFSSLVHQASQMPEVRSEVVDAFKTRIQAGHYPGEDIVAGLTKLMGGVVAQAAKSGK